MEVRVVLYLDPVDAEETVSVGYLIEREDHIILLNDIVGKEGDPHTRVVIPKSHVLLIDTPLRPISLTLHTGGKPTLKHSPTLTIKRGGRDGPQSSGD